MYRSRRGGSFRRSVALFGVVVSLLATACGGSVSGGNGSGRLSVVASVFPLGWLAEQIAPEAEHLLLSAGGLEAHGLEITPRQRGAIQTADVVAYVGPVGYQPQVEQAVESTGAGVVALSEIAGPERVLAPSEEEHREEEHREEEHREEPGSAIDPHLWFSPGVMADAARRLGEAFATADPAGAGRYRDAAESLSQRFVELGDDLDRVLGGPCRHQEVIVSHQAYRYLLEPYGVRQLGVSGPNPEGGASSETLAGLVNRIDDDGLEYVLTEAVEGRSGAETVAREAGVELLEVSPLDAVTVENAKRGVLALVRQQAATFATALGCGGR